MRLIREIDVTLTGGINLTENFGGQPVRGMDVCLVQNLVDPLGISSFSSGSPTQHFYGQPVDAAALGTPYVFGGPVYGPDVLIEWQGTIDAKRARFRFWDELVPPFGRVLLARRYEPALAGTATTAFPIVNTWGSWVRQLEIHFWADQAADLSLIFSEGTLVTVPPQVVALGASGFQILAPFVAPLSLEGQITAGAVGPVATGFTVWGLLG